MFVREVNKMNTILPVLIVLSLGAGSGLTLSRWLSNRWLTSIIAGIAGTIMWGVGMEILFHLTRPDKDMGRTHYEGILIVFLVASIASLIALTLRKPNNGNTNKSMQETP